MFQTNGNNFEWKQFKMETILNGTSGEFSTLCKYMYIFVFFLMKTGSFSAYNVFYYLFLNV